MARALVAASVIRRQVARNGQKETSCGLQRSVDEAWFRESDPAPVRGDGPAIDGEVAMRIGYGLVLVCVAQVATNLMAQRGFPGAVLVAAADADRDGQVTQEEWGAFRKQLGADATGTVSGDLVKAFLLRGTFDRDGDGKLGKKDLQALFAVWDANGDGSIGKDEWGGSARGRRGGYATEIVCVAADPGEKLQLPAEQWKKFLDAIVEDADKGIAMPVVATWIAAAEKRAPANRNAINASVYLTTLDGQLDRDKNGRITLGDLDALFAAVDANGDGILAASEARPAARGQRTRQPRTGQPGVGPRAGMGFGNRGAVSAQARSLPCLIPWQRNLEDALALVRQTGKPLLICVNMDGESASESLAWGRYRDPAFAKLVSGYIPILASPDKHSSRDRDDQGNRLPDPRFGRVIDSEHIDIEPTLFKRYFQGRRVAPRHVAVSPKGEILFDLFLLGNLGVIDEKLAEFGKPGPLPDPAKMSEHRLLASPDAGCRDRLEQLYRESAEAVRHRLARASLSSHRETQHPEILRMAMRDSQPAVRRAALETLALHPKQASWDLFPLAFLAAGQDQALGESLVEALRVFSADSEDAQVSVEGPLLADKRAALLTRSKFVDPDAWSLALARATPIADPPLSVDEVPVISDALDRLDREFEKRPDDPELLLRSAELNWRFARVRMAQTKNPMFLLEDVKASAARALTGPAQAPRARALLALANHYLDQGEEAWFWARQALPGMRAQVADPLVPMVLDVYLQRARGKLYEVLADTKTVPTDGYLVPDLIAAHELRLRLGRIDEASILRYAELFDVLADRRREQLVVERGLALFPRSGQLHAKMRTLTLETHGADALAAYYRDFRRSGEEAAWADWFAGLGLHFAAERYLANRRPTQATQTWKECFARFDSSFAAIPGFRDSTAAFLGFAWTGMAQIAIAAEDWPGAAQALTRSLEANPKGLEETNGLDQSPSKLAATVLGGLQTEGYDEEATKLRSVLTANGWRTGGTRRR